MNISMQVREDVMSAATNKVISDIDWTVKKIYYTKAGESLAHLSTGNIIWAIKRDMKWYYYE